MANRDGRTKDRNLPEKIHPGGEYQNTVPDLLVRDHPYSFPGQSTESKLPQSDRSKHARLELQAKLTLQSASEEEVTGQPQLVFALHPTLLSPEL